ncbi:MULTISPECIES: JAB domain-containing protein [Chryseobacterium]|uniref:DNA repair protein RadC n=1 Tax=Chryseobacterium taihuense TaxID=1141221 RepID=A0A4U8WDD1_9FLAO|nr:MULTISPECIES: JAB domain-containing protein [Chryseobacterium]QQV03764.1 JAB domain-containing protein [Chryseobacterium sp. FDAARGOS 1104]VFB02895.1 DNA repair protein RadC [Chryseobacterium taihuense]
MNNTISEVSEIQVSYKPNKNIDLKITTSFDAVQIIRKFWNEETIEMQEEVKVILLNNSNCVLGIYNLSKGGITSSLVDVRLVLSVALKCLAPCIILVHNHPSGNLKPSSADLNIVKKLNESCKLLDISLLDSIIITKESYMSFADKELI